MNMPPILPRFLKPGRVFSRRRFLLWQDGGTVAEAAKSPAGDKAEERMRKFAFFRLDRFRPRGAGSGCAGGVPAGSRQTRFFVFAAALAALWLYFLFTPAA